MDLVYLHGVCKLSKKVLSPIPQTNEPIWIFWSWNFLRLASASPGLMLGISLRIRKISVFYTFPLILLFSLSPFFPDLYSVLINTFPLSICDPLNMKHIPWNLQPWVSGNQLLPSHTRMLQCGGLTLPCHSATQHLGMGSGKYQFPLLTDLGQGQGLLKPSHAASVKCEKQPSGAGQLWEQTR